MKHHGYLSGLFFLLLLLSAGCGEIVMPTGIMDLRSAQTGFSSRVAYRIEGSVQAPEGASAEGIRVQIDGLYIDTPDIRYEEHYLPVCTIETDSLGKFITDSLQANRNAHQNLRLLFSDPAGRYATDSLIVRNIQYHFHSDSCFILKVSPQTLRFL